MPEEEVNVVYDGVLNGRKWWILRIKPNGDVNLWKQQDAYVYQQISPTELMLDWRGLGQTVSVYVNNIIASLDIEGLAIASNPAPVGGIEYLSEITYKVVPVSE